MEVAKTVLLIDDNTLMLEALSELLQLDGANVLCAEDGSSGVRLAREERPDLIISDYSMPGMDGCEVLKAVREDGALNGVPFIFLTAHGTPVLREQCLRMGAEEVFEKGDVLDQLLRTVREKLGLIGES